MNSRSLNHEPTQYLSRNIPVAFQVAALLASLVHPGHIVLAMFLGISSLAVALHVEIQSVYSNRYINSAFMNSEPPASLAVL
ncbi:hypothetical protein [Xenorhabdus mauleonii]|uniref:hypothetical protein n=1 Tax=Xenorhabdus mauleonii TaxID=351675 RepID=UPI001113A34B|nr:hypothetical protein [Xenorhabdus mauleonii]